jgi:CDP-glucose 4,6-dehydratase
LEVRQGALEDLEMNPARNDFWHDRRVFITGATGLVGYWLLQDLLALGARLTVFSLTPDLPAGFCRPEDRPRISVVPGKVEDFSGIERALGECAADTVFHLAAQSLASEAQRSPLPTFEANIRGTGHLLEACRGQAGRVKRVVLASSDRAYGPPERLPCTETMPLQGRHPYAVSKSCADLIAQAYHHTYGLPVAILRSGNLYGGGDLNWSRIVPYTIRCLLDGRRPVLRSDGRAVRDYLYVKDISRGYLRLAEGMADPAVAGQAFNFSLEHPVTVLELVSTIQRLMNCSRLAPEVQDKVSDEIPEQYMSAARAHRVLNWQPQFTLEQGLNETIAWYREYLANHPEPA